METNNYMDKKLEDDVINCKDLHELKTVIIPRLRKQQTAWKDKIKEIIDESGYAKNEFAQLCHVSRGTVYKWCNGSVPNDKNKFIRIGIVAGYDIKKVNELLTRYGHYAELYAKRLEDCVCIFVLSHNYGKGAINQYDYILDEIKQRLFMYQKGTGYDIPTDELLKKLILLKKEKELEEFVNESVNIFLFVNQKLYSYIKSTIQNIDPISINCMAERQGWTSSLRQCVSEVRQNKWYPNRYKLISLGVHFGFSYEKINQMLMIAHMEPLQATNIAESVIIFILKNAGSNKMIMEANKKEKADLLCVFAKEIIKNLGLPELEVFYREFEDIDGEK